MRIVKIHWKVAYFAIAWLVGFAIARLLDLVLPPLAVYIVILLMNAAAYLTASRTFRVRGEPVEPPRAWWRMTGRPKASLVLAILQLASILGGVSFLEEKDGAVRFASNAVLSMVFAALLFNSYVRLRREKPSGWASPTTAEWRPAPLPRALR